MHNLTNPDLNKILSDVVAKEPLGPAVHQGDDAWFQIVRWVHFAMLLAEEGGVTSANVDDEIKSEIPAIRRLLGSDGNQGEMLGLSNDWAYRIIKLVGNYGEVFERNVGQASQLKLPRGQNALWINGGLQYAPPIR
jgi:general L-amino acid transport system substrate-binding protein